jgi:uncharacterized repeat protein (TIGR01451 family)
MKRFHARATMALLGIGLVGWAALAWGQAGSGPTSANGLPAVEGPNPAIHEVPSGTSGIDLPAGPSARPLPPAGAPVDLPKTASPLLPAAAPLGGTPAAPNPLPPSGSGSLLPLGSGSTQPPVGAGGLPGSGGSLPGAPDPLTGGLPGPRIPPVGGLPGPGLPPPTAGLPGLDNSMTPAAGRGTTSTPGLLPAERSVEPLTPPEGASGRQEPSVSLEWIGPGAAKIGVPGDYTLAVRNSCNIPVQQVLVRVRIPQGLSVSGTQPAALAEGNVLVWELGTLQPKQDRNLQMKLVAETRGDVMPQAWVTFTGSAVMRIKIREPKLALKIKAPEKVLLGEEAEITLTVSNPGDGSADQVKIHATISDGLEHGPNNKTDFDIGNLAAGESRDVNLPCRTRAGGSQKVEAVAEADGGLTSRDTAALLVSMPKLDLQMSGPALRYLGRKAIYILKVSNTGDAPATNVTVQDVVPEGFKVLASSHGGRYDSSLRQVSWFLGEVGPGQPREVQLEVQAVNPGEFKHRASATAARGLKVASELTTRVEGLSALMVEMVDLDDPIEVNGETAYEVRITNTGSKAESDIKLVATIPDKMEFKNAQSQVPYHPQGRTIVFDAIDKLAPRADAIIRINVKALEPGTAYFKIQVTSANILEPILKTEATRIYSDAPDARSSTTPAGIQ